jgi:hypothetical protein
MLDFVHPGLEFLIYLAAAIVIAGIYMVIRKIKLNRLIRREQLTNPTLFNFGVETSMAVSENGRIGMINFRLGTLVIDMREIVEFEVILGRFCIMNAKASKNDGMIFHGISDRLKPIFAEEEKFKEITFVIRLKKNRLIAINLYKSARPRARVIPAKQQNILRLFETLQTIEETLK